MSSSDYNCSTQLEDSIQPQCSCQTLPMVPVGDPRRSNRLTIRPIFKTSEVTIERIENFLLLITYLFKITKIPRQQSKPSAHRPGGISSGPQPVFCRRRSRRRSEIFISTGCSVQGALPTKEPKTCADYNARGRTHHQSQTAISRWPRTDRTRRTHDTLPFHSCSHLYGGLLVDLRPSSFRRRRTTRPIIRQGIRAGGDWARSGFDSLLHDLQSVAHPHHRPGIHR